ncbi:MAG: phosphoribosylglycinamide formyltransferase [Rhodobacteraceae bacterium]|nr:MAG: phosphoribosylglycinamide formyltransferase [Paracoccaceae bacterium]
MSRLRVAVVISGRGSNMLSLLDAMADPAFPAQPVLVAANLPDAGGLAAAAARGVPTACVDHRPFGADRTAFEQALSAEIEAAEADCVCLAGFMRKLTPWFVARWRDRALNIHPSLLPAFRGLDTHARALAAGVAVHGCTVHLLRDDLDDGPILGQAALAVRAGENADGLARRVLAIEHRLYPACLAAWACGARRVEGDRLTGAPIALFEG